MRWLIGTALGMIALCVFAGRASPRTELSRADVLRLRAFREDETVPLPSIQQIERVEQALSVQTCVHDLGLWQRRYARKIDYERGHVDMNKIWFDLRRASRGGYMPGRRVGRLQDLFGVDERSKGLASGTYDLATGQLTVEFCNSEKPAEK